MSGLPGVDVWQMWATLAGVGFIIVVYALDRFSMEVVSAGVVAFALVFFHLFPLPATVGVFGAPEILSGFANPALITIMALLVIGQAVYQTGALDGPARWLSDRSESRPRAVLLIVFFVVFVVSAFLNNTPVVVMFIPIAAALAARMQHSPSKIMMPLSFVCILAGMTTLIGSSTNLLVADALKAATGEQLGFFAPTRFGLVLAGVGLIYLITFGWRLLPDAGDTDSKGAALDGRQFVAQIDVTAGHPLVNAAPVAGMFPDLASVTVRAIVRGSRNLLPPFDDVVIAPGDRVLVAATRRALLDLLSKRSDLLRGVDQLRDTAGDPGAPEEGLSLVEAVVAPGSRALGRTIAASGLDALSGVVVIGVQRRARMSRQQLDELRLEEGDILLFFVTESGLEELRDQRDVLPLEWRATHVPRVARANAARLVFIGVVAAAATETAPILHASVVGAFAMVALQCLNVRQAARAFDLRIFMLIGAAFALGGALDATGAADFLAELVVRGFAPFGAVALMSALFALVAVLTNVLSNSATAILFAPVAISAAERVDASPEAFVLAVLFAANCSFVTPIAYQTNMLVMGPGRYGFNDFVRVGGPLAIVMWIAFTLLAPWAFGL